MNNDLNTAKYNKNDEFYTSYIDIENELNYYNLNNFYNKIIYLPCDDYEISNFYKYFENNFHKYKFKKLIATCINFNGKGKYIEFDGYNKIIKELNYNGDFKSKECYDLMNNCDIIITNPPFSKFREFVKQLTNLNKDFIILGQLNAISYKEVFKYIISNKIKLGPSIHSGDRCFKVPDDYPLYGTACFENNGIKFIRVKGVRWFTTLNFKNYKVKDTILHFSGNNLKYEKFDTYDAININVTNEIPYNYDKIIAAPISVLDKMNNDGYLEFKKYDGDTILFKIIGQLNAGNNQNFDFAKPIINGKCKFKRILIQKI